MCALCIKASAAYLNSKIRNIPIKFSQKVIRNLRCCHHPCIAALGEIIFFWPKICNVWFYHNMNETVHGPNHLLLWWQISVNLDIFFRGWLIPLLLWLILLVIKLCVVYVILLLPWNSKSNNLYARKEEKAVMLLNQ